MTCYLERTLEESGFQAFVFHRLQFSVCCLAQQFCPVVTAEALFLNHGQSTEYLESDKTYLLPIWCSLIALRLLLCLRHCQDIPMLIYSWSLDFVQGLVLNSTWRWWHVDFTFYTFYTLYMFLKRVAVLCQNIFRISLFNLNIISMTIMFLKIHLDPVTSV